ncbi:MAG: FecR domain-containing protein [Gracilimonas sp.]
MENNQNISPNDQDLLLARKIGASLPDINSLYAENDPLLNALLQYKKSQVQKQLKVDSDKLWNAINSDMSASQKPAKIFILYPSFKKYAVAAAIIIAAFIGIVMYQSYPRTVLMGESFASIEIIDLPDGSTVTLRPYSKLYQENYSEKNQYYHLEGEAYFEVTSNIDRLFTVSTNHSKVEVLGTKFILSEWGNKSSVYLEEGQIKYSSIASKQSVVLEPGQASKADELGTIPQITDTDGAIYKDWLQNELVFKNESAEMVFSELEQHFNINIESDTVAKNADLSGSIQLDQLQSVLDNLELVLNGTFTQTGERSYTFVQN